MGAKFVDPLNCRMMIAVLLSITNYKEFYEVMLSQETKENIYLENVMPLTIRRIYTVGKRIFTSVKNGNVAIYIEKGIKKSKRIIINKKNQIQSKMAFLFSLWKHSKMR